GGEDRVEEGPGVADHDPARAAHLFARVRIVAGDAHVGDALRACHAVFRVWHHRQRPGQEVGVVRARALLEVFRLAHAADAGFAARQRDEPGPAVFEAVHADDVAGRIAGVVVDVAVVRVQRGALVFQI